MLILYHDYTSPASAVAVARVQRLIDEGLAVSIAGTEALGVEATLPVTVDLLAELDRVAAAATVEGVDLRRPAMIPPTASAHLVEDVARAHGAAAAWRRRCYRAFWRDGENIADHAVLRRLAGDVGLPAQPVTEALGDRVALLAIRRRFAGHRHEGVGGVPVLSYNGTLIPGLLDEADLRALAALDSVSS